MSLRRKTPPPVRVWLVRHAPAEDRTQHTGPDLERPLSAAGRRKGLRALQGLVTVLGRPAVVLTSPARRAVETADLLDQALGRPAVRVEDARLAPGASVSAIQKAVSAVGRRRGPVVVVGHEPDLGNLVGRLTGLSGAGFKKAGAAELEWGEDGRALLLSWLPPRVLRRLARVAR